MRALLEAYYLESRRPKVSNSSNASSEDFKMAKEGLKTWMASTDQLSGSRRGTTAGLVALRYRYELTGIREYGGTKTFEFNVYPLGGKTVQGPGLIGSRQTSLFKTPKNAIKEIPKNAKWAYRGMSWAEWQYIRKNKAIKSRGGYNLGQKGLTFFAPDPGSGKSYAGGWAPVQHQASKKRPGVIIAVDKKHMLTPKDREDIPEGELAIEGSLPMSEIKGVWFLVPTESRGGTMELVRTEKVKRSGSEYTRSYSWSEGSRSSPVIYTALIKYK